MNWYSSPTPNCTFYFILEKEQLGLLISLHFYRDEEIKVKVVLLVQRMKERGLLSAAWKVGAWYFYRKNTTNWAGFLN